MSKVPLALKQGSAHELVMRSSSCLVMSEVPSTLKQGSAHELVNVKLITFNNAGGTIGTDLEACVSLIRAKANAWVMLGAFGAMPLACIPNSSPSQSFHEALHGLHLIKNLAPSQASPMRKSVWAL
jgi:hypothetical protein